jgi:thiol-disulfide isomerase/thioredoxin
VKEPFIERANQQTDTHAVVQKVLIEDFTGHRCGNCPRAHEKIEELHGIYGDRVITIAIHSGYFATPAPASGYPADYRCTAGNDITSFYGVTDYPTGMVSRKELSGQKLISYGDWGGETAAILQQQPIMGITITNTYSSGSRQIQTKAELLFKESVSEQLKICMFITEDSIISPQTDYSLTPNKIDNYVHRHVLRGSMNGSFGENLPLSSYASGASVSVTKSLTLDAAWNESNCYVVVYLYKESSEEIVQVEEKKVK